MQFVEGYNNDRLLRNGINLHTSIVILLTSLFICIPMIVLYKLPEGALWYMLGYITGGIVLVLYSFIRRRS